MSAFDTLNGFIDQASADANAESLGLTPNGDGTYSNPETPGVVYDANGNATGGGGSVATPLDSPMTPPTGATQQDANGNWYDSAGTLLKQIAPLSPILKMIATPYLNNIASGGMLNKAQSMLTGAGSGISNVAQPNLMSMIPELQLQVQQGTMTPAQASASLAQLQGQMSPAQYEAAQQALSNMQGVTSDASSISGARAALGQLADIGMNNGMTAADRAQFAQTMNQANANAAQQRAAQLQQLQMQGNAGAGAELAARLAGGQQTANANALAGANLSQQAQARALAALQAGVSGNTNLNQQLFAQEAEKAKAQDVINQFNTQAANAAAQYNAGNTQASNLANYNTANQMAQYNAGNQQQTNLANAQNQQASNLANFNTANTIGATNTGIMNEQAKMPMTTAQQQYTNAMDQAKNAANANLYGGKALGDMATGQITRTTTATGKEPSAAMGTGSGNSTTTDLNNIGKAVDIATKVGDLISDERVKTDKRELSDADVDRMMAEMTGFKYRYKGPKTNPMQTGVMAQDVESGMPSSVVNTPAGKVIQGPQVMGQALAILANQHRRILDLENKK